MSNEIYIKIKWALFVVVLILIDIKAKVFKYQMLSSRDNIMPILKRSFAAMALHRPISERHVGYEILKPILERKESKLKLLF